MRAYWDRVEWTPAWNRAVQECHLAEAVLWSQGKSGGPLVVSHEMFLTAMWFYGETW